MADRAAIAIENARLYDAVRAANNAKSEFVSLVAHELKVPMTSIQGYADLLPMTGPINEKQEQFINTIKNAVNKMKVLVSDLSDISRIESGQLRVERSEEHTSELQSPDHLVCRLLLEKKKNTNRKQQAPNEPTISLH